jgi:hypothetical protein
VAAVGIGSKDNALSRKEEAPAAVVERVVAADVGATVKEVEGATMISMRE